MRLYNAAHRDITYTALPAIVFDEHLSNCRGCWFRGYQKSSVPWTQRYAYTTDAELTRAVSQSFGSCDISSE